MADLAEVSAGLLLQQVATQQSRIADDMSVIRDGVTKAAGRIDALDKLNTLADQIHADHEGRLRVLERFRLVLIGVALAAGAASGYLADLLAHVGHP